MRAILGGIPGAVLLCAALACGTAQAASQAEETIAHGKALTEAADCAGCHTADPAKPFAGGRLIETPFGGIYSPNLTPDRETGLGGWSDDQFYRALHQGVAPDGSRYYPAFPYPNFTKLIRDDVLAIRAYLATLPPIHKARPPSQLHWPLNYRVVMRVWNWLFFRPGIFEPDQNKSPAWNCGGYLVEGAAHCGACHTPRNIFGADKRGQRFGGGRVQGWFAPRLDNAPRSGLQSWSVDDIAEYLQSGRNARSHAGGAMAEVVVHSTSKMSDADVRAIAVYLKGLPGGRAGTCGEPAAAGGDGGGCGHLCPCLRCLPRGRRRRRAADLSAAARQCQSAVGRSLKHAAYHSRRRPDGDDAARAQYRFDAGLRQGPVGPADRRRCHLHSQFVG